MLAWLLHTLHTAKFGFCWYALFCHCCCAFVKMVSVCICIFPVVLQTFQLFTHKQIVQGTLGHNL